MALTASAYWYWELDDVWPAILLILGAGIITPLAIWLARFLMNLAMTPTRIEADRARDERHRADQAEGRLAALVETQTSAEVDLKFEVAIDGRDTVLRGIVDNKSKTRIETCQIRLERSELCVERQSDGRKIWHDYEVGQVLLPWAPENTQTKSIAPRLRGSRFEVARLRADEAVARVPGTSGESGLSFTTAGCHRLLLTLFADNLAAQTAQVEFKVVLGGDPAQRFVLQDCECGEAKDH